MNHLKKLLTAAVVAFVGAIAFAAPASAQVARTYVSGTGDDANPCSITAPCKTFAGAISKTSAGGEINCQTTGGFGAVTITKAITIHCDGLTAGVLVSGTNGVIVNAGANDSVVLSGLDFEGTGTGLKGVNVLAAGSVTIRNSIIRGFNGAASWGIFFNPSTNAKLLVDNVTLVNNGTSNSGSIAIQPQSTGNATATITNSRVMSGQGTGILVSSVAVTGGSILSVDIRDSTVTGNVGGVTALAPAGQRSVQVGIHHSTIAQNSAYAVFSNGSSAQNRLWGNVISNNDTALLTSGGFIVSYGDNVLFGNNTDGTFNATVARQ